MTNIEKTRRYYDLVWNERKLELIDDWVTDDFVGHYSAWPEPVRGPAGFREFVETGLTALPDLRMTIEDAMAVDEKVISRVTMSGTHTGPMMGFAPTGRQVSVGYIAIEHYRGGRAFEEWVYSDDLALSRQIGALPEPGSLGERIGQKLFALRAARMRRKA
ncbi:MAG: hypothetical protein QOJ29_971 [Thermoleophilaceae bacterium]|jgi:steroid delta-isomerase-like uncharacterized protein|nr:hypothetical protein [Thermoleophilaceae bacterium]